MADFCAILSSEQKALQLNLNPQIYGSFAEIGAGQEVARHFFRAGGASGTVAKTISAYDMTISDSLYGKESSGRYVCRSRLEKMLSIELTELVDRLGEKRGDKSLFFSFANTIATTPFKSEMAGHGWMGVSFIHEPHALPSSVVIHIKMFDLRALDQHSAIGILGVNLIHACYFSRSHTGQFVSSLVDQLHGHHLEVSMIHVSGPAFSDDPRLFQLELIKRGQAAAILFDPKGESKQPDDLFYKKSLVLLRGSFRPPSKLNIDMLKQGQNLLLKRNPELDVKNIFMLPEISMNQLRERGEVDTKDFLARIDLLGLMNLPVIVTKFSHYFQLSQYLTPMKLQHLHFVMTGHSMEEVMKQENYEQLAMTQMEGLGKLFSPKVSVSVYPTPQIQNGPLLYAKDMQLPMSTRLVYTFLKRQHHIFEIQEVDESVARIWSQEILHSLQNGDEQWKQWVPEKIMKKVLDDQLFNTIV